MASPMSHPEAATSAISFISEDDNRVVRFDKECVLIPEAMRSKKAILVTKAYALPLFRRRTASESGEYSEDPSPTFKVPVPSFIAKNSRSPSRTRDSVKPLSPCLVHRVTSSSQALPRRPITRRPSLPSSSPPSEQFAKPLVTVPLRACCTNCFHVTDQCLKSGHWEEKFSRGARRRRNSSVSSDDFSMPQTPGASSGGFTAVSANHAGYVAPAVVSASFGKVLSITVDEVDKRHRSPDRGIEQSTEPLSPAMEPPPPKSSPIPEEDEDQLFPLPSPRRTPSSSPAQSLEASPAPSPSPSPTGSRIILNGSRESLGHSQSGSDEVLPGSITRRGRCDKGLLLPEHPRPKPTISIPAPTTQHLRASSSPSHSPSAVPIPVSHSRYASSPSPRSVTSPPSSRSVTSPPVSRTRTNSASTSPVSRRQPSSLPSKFSPTIFFKEALKGVSSMGGVV